MVVLGTYSVILEMAAPSLDPTRPGIPSPEVLVQMRRSYGDNTLYRTLNLATLLYTIHFEEELFFTFSPSGESPVMNFHFEVEQRE